MNKVTVSIPTKDRTLELGILLQTLLFQTFQEFDILIIDDCSYDTLQNNTTIQGLIKLFTQSDHNVTIIEGKRQGPHIAGQMILDNANTELILRLDDDVALRPTFIEELLKIFENDIDKTVGAVGPIYLNPHESLTSQHINYDEITQEHFDRLRKVFWDEHGNLFLSGYLQINTHSGTNSISVEHLNSGFMYRKSAGLKMGGYCLDFSPVGHREESDFSYRLFREGYKLFVNPNAIAYHFHPMSGGIRETNGKMLDKSNWDHDEKIFLDRMEKWIPKNNKLLENNFTSVIILTHGMHKDLRELLTGIVTYTNHNCEYIIFNNDPSKDSRLDISTIVTDEFPQLNAKVVVPDKKLSVSAARNKAVEYTNNKSKFICFIDDDARVLGRYNQTTDWVDYLYNRFHEQQDVGAVSPILTWFDEFKCYVVSVACLFTSKKVWDIVGGFDRVFGNIKKGTWGYEDTDWSYRCGMKGFKLLGVRGLEFPFYHEDTTGKRKTAPIQMGLIRAKDFLMSKYDINKIQEYNRTCYPFTKEQMDVQGVKLNVGCYYMKLDRFINIDIKDDIGADLVCNTLDLKKHFQDNSVSLILASQVFEHLNYEDGKKTLKIWYDILKPGGILIVEVPNGDNTDEKLAKGELTEQDMFTIHNGNPSEFGQKHEIVYTTKMLQKMLVETCFVDLVLNPDKSDSDDFAIRFDCRKG